jgi:anti-sigma B factor antagonist
MSLQISTTPVTPDTAVVVFTGNLTLGMTLSSIDSQIQTMIGKGLCRLVFDLTAVSYVDSAALGVFIHAAGLAREKKGMVRLCGVAERVSTLLKLTGMDAVLPIDADADTRLASFTLTQLFGLHLHRLLEFFSRMHLDRNTLFCEGAQHFRICPI